MFRASKNESSDFAFSMKHDQYLEPFNHDEPTLCGNQKHDQCFQPQKSQVWHHKRSIINLFAPISESPPLFPALLSRNNNNNNNNNMNLFFVFGRYDVCHDLPTPPPALVMSCWPWFPAGNFEIWARIDDIHGKSHTHNKFFWKSNHFMLRLGRRRPVTACHIIASRPRSPHPRYDARHTPTKQVFIF